MREKVQSNRENQPLFYEKFRRFWGYDDTNLSEQDTDDSGEEFEDSESEEEKKAEKEVEGVAKGGAVSPLPDAGVEEDKGKDKEVKVAGEKEEEEVSQAGVEQEIVVEGEGGARVSPLPEEEAEAVKGYQHDSKEENERMLGKKTIEVTTDTLREQMHEQRDFFNQLYEKQRSYHKKQMHEQRDLFSQLYEKQKDYHEKQMHEQREFYIEQMRLMQEQWRVTQLAIQASYQQTLELMMKGSTHLTNLSKTIDSIPVVGSSELSKSDELPGGTSKKKKELNIKPEDSNSELEEELELEEDSELELNKDKAKVPGTSGGDKRPQAGVPGWSSYLLSMINPVSWFGAGVSHFKAPGIKSKFVGVFELLAGTAVGMFDLAIANTYTLSVYDLSIGEVGYKAKASFFNAITSGLSAINPESASYFRTACSQWDEGTFVGIGLSALQGYCAYATWNKYKGLEEVTKESYASKYLVVGLEALATAAALLGSTALVTLPITTPCVIAVHVIAHCVTDSYIKEEYKRSHAAKAKEEKGKEKADVGSSGNESSGYKKSHADKLTAQSQVQGQLVGA